MSGYKADTEEDQRHDKEAVYYIRNFLGHRYQPHQQPDKSKNNQINNYVIKVHTLIIRTRYKKAMWNLFIIHIAL